MPFDFPSSPTEGQIFNAPSGPSYVYNNPVWRAMAQGQIAIISDTAPANPANGTLWYESDTGILFIWYNDGNSAQWVQVGGIATVGAVVQTIILSSATYTKPAGLRYLEVECQAGGGGGGACVGTSAGQYSVGAGGGGGGWCRKLYAAPSVPATVAMTVGAGGTAPISAGFDGNPGGNTVFMGMTATGGSGGGGAQTAGSGAQELGGGGGSASGDFDMYRLGGGGQPGYANFFIANNQPGGGGSSMYGGEGRSFLSNNTTGANGAGYGSGGSGSANGPSLAQRVGGTGAGGCIILKEYF